MGCSVGLGQGAGGGGAGQDLLCGICQRLDNETHVVRNRNKRFLNPNAVLSCGFSLTGECVCAGEDVPSSGKRALHQRASDRYGGAGPGQQPGPVLGAGGSPVQGQGLHQVVRNV